MLKREDVLVGLLLEGKFQLDSSIIYVVTRSGQYICAEPLTTWRVRVWDEVKRRYICAEDFAEDDVLEAVDTFLRYAPLGVDFPDAHVLQEVNKQFEEHAYKDWCEAHRKELNQLAERIYKVNEKGKRTIVVDVRIDGTEGNYTRYLREHHFGTHAQVYSAENTEKKGLLAITISWAK